MRNMETNNCGSHEQSVSDSDLEIIEISSPAHQTDHAEYLDGEGSPRSKNTVHLWEYLLELLADESCRSIITWSRKLHGEFKIKNPQEIASRWGRLKHRPGMTYEKLSRALRHYYCKGIIRKVKGQRLVYRFHKLPYEYTTGRDCSPSKDGVSTQKTTIRQDEYKYDGPSPCSKTNVDGSSQALLDRNKMKRFFEERLHNTKNKVCNPPNPRQMPETQLPVKSPEQSYAEESDKKRQAYNTPQEVEMLLTIESPEHSYRNWNNNSPASPQEAQETQSPVKSPEQGHTDESNKKRQAYNTPQEVETLSTIKSPEHSYRDWNTNSPASPQEAQETRSPTDSHERSADLPTSGFRLVVPIPIRPSICPECITRLMPAPFIHSSFTLPISTNERTGFVPCMSYAATSIPVSVIRKIRS